MDPGQIFRRTDGDFFAARRDVVVALVHPRDEIRQRPAAVRGDDLQSTVAVEEAVVDHACDGERRIERESDRCGELEARHVHRGHTRRRRGVDQHRQRARIDRPPDRVECRFCQRPPVDVREHHHPGRTRRRGTFELGERALRILPRERCEPAQAIGMRRACRSHVVIHDLCRLKARVGSTPVAVRTGERDDGHIDPDLVHRPQPQIVVEHRRDRCHERRTVEMDRAHAAGDLAHGVARAAMLLQQREPRLGQAVSVHIDDRAHGGQVSSV